MGKRYHIAAGELRDEVELQRPLKSSPNTSGGRHVRVYDPVARVAASVQPLAGRELLMAGQVGAGTTHRVVIRYRPDVRSNWRMKLGDRVLELTGPPINVENRNVRLECMAAEIEPDQETAP